MRYLNPSGHFPSGNVRYYFRPRGGKNVPMPDAKPDSPEFRAAYVQAEKSLDVRGVPGTLDAAIAAFVRSREFAARAPGTRQNWARTLDDLRARYGRFDFAAVRTRDIRSDLSRYDLHPANNRLKVWKALYRWLEDKGRIDVDPARPIRKQLAPKTDGFIAWTRDDFAAFRARWSHETPQRLAFEVYYRTCAATIDAVRIGPGMVSGGWLTYRRSKTGAEAVIPWQDAPAWFEWTDDLELCLAAQPRHMTFIVTAHGKSRSEKAASQWFAKACRDAGLDLSAHGIRKGRAAMFRENGATEDQRMAILGHETDAEARNYSRSADLKRVVAGTKGGEPFPTLVQLDALKPRK